MTKRTKMVAALLAAMMAFSAVCFGFSSWSTEIELSGSVSASGSWDVEVTDASLTVCNAGTAVTQLETETVATAEVTVYPIVLGNSNGVNYYMVVDDQNPATVTVTAEELAEYSITYSTLSGYSRYFTSGEKNAKVTLKLQLTELGESLVALSGTSVSTGTVGISKEGAEEGAIVAYGIVYTIGSNSLTNDNVVATYSDAKTATAAGTTITYSDAVYTATSVSYADVNFSLNGAWAEYSVTITNFGTVNANLSDYAFEVSELDEIFTVDTPELTDDVLAPGESCTFTFVIQVDTEADSFSAESTDFTVTLVYAQDAVEAAPTASHSAHTTAEE